MKRILFCCVFMLMFGNAYATTLAVCGLDGLACTAPKYGINYESNITDWYLICDAIDTAGTVHENMKLVGESLCVAESVLDNVDTNTKAITAVAYGSTPNANNLCVCRTTSPFVSSWFAPYTFGYVSFSNAANCNIYCSQYCARVANDDSAWIKASQISD